MNRWSQPDIPHKGWELETVYDVRTDGQRASETDYEKCMMCNNEPIRYVHVLSHDDVEEDFHVGCVCAEKMLNDYIGPRNHERRLRNKAARRRTWLNQDWKFSANGNWYLKKDGHYLLVYKDKRSGKHKCKLDETFGNKQFETVAEAKAALFEGMERLKDRGEW